MKSKGDGHQLSFPGEREGGLTPLGHQLHPQLAILPIELGKKILDNVSH